jgi:hypothetical protein
MKLKEALFWTLAIVRRHCPRPIISELKKSVETEMLWRNWMKAK